MFQLLLSKSKELSQNFIKSEDIDSKGLQFILDLKTFRQNTIDNYYLINVCQISIYIIN